ncbi:MAG: polymerase sigma-70 factor [Bacteroidetes bacterium]|nr:polymerase sigma-70 factor [Bacteroidota bacterium]
MVQNELHNEQELLKLVVAGDTEAYKVIYTHYWDRIYTTALAFTKSPELSEDVAQEVFAQIWVKRAMLKEVERFDGFLYITTRNLLLDRLRRKVFTGSLDDYFTEYFADVNGTPAQQLEFKEFDSHIQRAISQLTPQQQTVFKLSRFEGLTHEEIAKRTGLAKRTVKNHMVNSILYLRKYLKVHAGNYLIFIWITFFL